MKKYSKSRLAAWLFDGVPMVGIKGSRKVISVGRIDGKRVYFLESRDHVGNLEESVTFNSIGALKGAL